MICQFGPKSTKTNRDWSTKKSLFISKSLPFIVLFRFIGQNFQIGDGVKKTKILIFDLEHFQFWHFKNSTIFGSFFSIYDSCLSRIITVLSDLTPARFLESFQLPNCLDLNMKPVSSWIQDDSLRLNSYIILIKICFSFWIRIGTLLKYRYVPICTVQAELRLQFHRGLCCTICDNPNGKFQIEI